MAGKGGPGLGLAIMFSMLPMTTKMATITVEQAKEISLQQENKYNCTQRRIGCRKLANYLGWEAFDDEANGQQSIRLDFLYDSLMFTIQKGFPWPQVCRLLSLASEMLEEAIGLSLVEALKLFKRKSAECLQSVSEHNLNIYGDFVLRTFMQHYKLYQFVYLNERERNVINTTIQVETPPTHEPFSAAKPAHIWEYDKKVEATREILVQRKQEHELITEDVLKEDAERKKELADQLDNISVPMDRETLLGIITDVAQVNVSVTLHQLQAAVEKLLDDFDIMFEPTALPRPEVLGPPPRFDIKTTPTPVEARSPSMGQKSNKSPKGYNSK